MMPATNRHSCLAILLLLATFCLPAVAQTEFNISDIRVEGLQRISEGTVFNYLPLEVGDEMTPNRAQEAIRALFRTGFFNDIRMDRQDSILVITVVERPAISEILIDGNKAIKEEDMRDALRRIGLSEGEVFDRLQLERVEQELTRQYFDRGKYSVVVDTRVTPLERNRVRISIDIREGDTARIRHINIVGNEVFSDDELLGEWESNTSNFLSFYTSDDRYSREKLAGDLEALRSFYLDRGYIDFDVESTQVSISPDKQEIFLTVNIREGEVFSVSEVDVTGDYVLGESDVRALLEIGPGDIFSRKEVELSIENITAVLSNVGYAFANVTPGPEINREDNSVRLVFFVDPGKRVYVRQVNFFGNVNTKDEVLRREMRQFEGAWFSQAAVERSRLRLQRLGFFSDVNIETPPVAGTDDQVDINVTVEERTAGSFAFGVGYSPTAGPVISASVTQENFLGTGNRIGVAINSSDFFKRFDISYLNPYWTDNGVSRGFSLSYRELDRGEANVADYTSNTVAASVIFGLPLTEVDRIQTSFGVDNTQINVIPGITPDEIVSQCDENMDGMINNGECDFDTYRTEITWSRDSRNRFFNPTAGSAQRILLELALPGSDTEYYKLFYRGDKYFPINRNFTLNIGGQIGYGDGYGDTDALPFFENFYAGGVRDIRGYDDNTLGPKDSFGNPLGGAFKVTGTIEVAFPMPFIGDSADARLAWFLDGGNVFSDFDAFEGDDLRYATGLSFQWQAPVGPVIINFAVPFNDQEGDETETIQFAFGNFF